MDATQHQSKGVENQTDHKKSESPQDIVGISDPKQFRVVSKTGFDHYLSKFKPNRNDIIICTMPKTGTTWLGLICHLLRGGNMEFQDLNQVVPWHQLGWDMNWDPASTINTMQSTLIPRLWKSHQLISAERPDARYITTIRHPISVLKSWHHFMKSKGIPKFVKRDVDELFAECPKDFQEGMFPFASAFKFLYEAYLLRDHPDVLVLCFEDLQKDYGGMLSQIASFMGFEKCSHDLLQRVVQLSSKRCMEKNVEKYDEGWSGKRLAKVGRSKIVWETFAKVSSVCYPEPSKETKEKCARLLTSEFSSHGVDKVKTYDDLRRAIQVSWKARSASKVSCLV